MKRVAERLGFTTMSLYRYVASKDELLLLMHDTVWRPPPGLDLPRDGWRGGLARWTREQYRDHAAPSVARPGPATSRGPARPSQIAWMDLGLRALDGTPLTEHHKMAVLLLLSGYVFAQARLAATAADGAQRGFFAPDAGDRRRSGSCCARSSTPSASRRCAAPSRAGRSRRRRAPSPPSTSASTSSSTGSSA